jgi:DNA polymerase-3 subunit delta'
MDLFGEPEIDAQDDDEDVILVPTEEQESERLPRQVSDLYGHSHIEQLLLESFNNERMPHGLIFSGPKGIGKSTLAYRLARFLLKAGIIDPNQDSLFGDPAPTAESLNVPLDHSVSRLVSSGAHPDLLAIERAYDANKDKFKDNVAVDDIRKVAPFLRKTASQGGWRIVIIDDADTMNRNAQNALLKILEEPPANTVLILIAHRMGVMIPTIRSRCRVINFQALSQADFSRILTKRGHILAAHQMETLYTLSEGSIGEALRFIESEGVQTLDSLLQLMNSYPSWPWAEIHKLGDQLSRSGRDEAYDQFAELLPWIYRQMIRAKARGQNLEGGHIQGNEALEAILRQSSLESLMKICENLEDLFATVQRSNLDKRQAVLSAFSLMAA